MEGLPYAVRTEREDGREVYVLEDRAARSQVWVCPDLGLNAYRFSIDCGGEDLAIIDPPPVLSELAADPAGYGLPILFPFPGRIAGNLVRYGGRVYPLGSRTLGLSGTHGFVLERPWQVEATGTSVGEGAVLVGRLESDAFPELADQWPSSFRLQARLSLRAGTLALDLRAQNTGHELLPVGCGLHPYLRAPLSSSGSAGGCLVSLPVTRRWELEDLVPTGRLLPLDEDWPAGVGLEGRIGDDVYTGVLAERGSSRAVLSDTALGLAVVVEADLSFRHWVFYTPPRAAVCLEPWTCVPNAVNLQQQGVETGLMVLAPGQAQLWAVRLTVRELGASLPLLCEAEE
jgi:aldose 1-epimerase